ncbi:MFS transporter [Microbispora sp. CA-102843]|uniref:MFS transporter n=1 Tax=Microbispora sp. CA-102843 TaxID=3239952 RepID=UPI003D924429
MVMAGLVPHFATARQAHHVVPAAAVVLIYTVVMAGGTLTIPLYVLWASKFGFGPVTTTLVFIAYVIGVVGTLLVSGSLSDAIGRCPVLALALALTALSTLGFALANSLTILLISRVVSGAATGLITATATSSVAEIVPGRKTAAVLATAANVGGLSLGTIAAGLLAQFVQAPTRTVFWCYLVVCAVASIAWLAVPETSDRRTGWQPRIRRPALPPGASRARSFLASGVLVAASSGVNGFFSSLAPAFLRDDLGISNLAVIGVGVGALFISALLAQIIAPPAILRRGSCRDSAPPRPRRHRRTARSGNRAELSATYFLFVYSGLVVPVLLLGFIDQAVGTRISSTALAALVICTALVGLTLGRSTEPAHLTPMEDPRD